MKKVIIALVLVSLIMVPVFAKTIVDQEFGAEVSAKFAVDAEGVKLAGIGVYGKDVITVGTDNKLNFNAKVGYVFSLDKDPAVSGVYVEVEKPLESVKTSVEFGPELAFGLAADFHMIDGSLKVNLAPEARFAVDMKYNPADSAHMKTSFGLSVKYALLNNTGVAPFSFDVEAGVLRITPKG